MIRYNNLKIFINSGEAKPGGTIGAMLSPYLFSTNMLDFCKKFNDMSNIYNNGLPLSVKLYTDIMDKTYTFFISLPNINVIYYNFARNAFLNNKKRLFILNIYDLLKYSSFVYNLNLFKASKILFGIIKSFRKRRVFLDFKDIFLLLLLKNGYIKK